MLFPRYIIFYSFTVLLLFTYSHGDRMIPAGKAIEDETRKEKKQITVPRRGWGWFAPFFVLDSYWNNTTLAGPTYKIEVDDDKVELTYDVVGYDNDQLNVDIKSGVLSISGEKRSEDSEKLSVSSFHHTFSVGPKVQFEDVSAQMTLDKKLVVVVSKKRNDEEPHASKVPILSLGEDRVD